MATADRIMWSTIITITNTKDITTISRITIIEAINIIAAITMVTTGIMITTNLIITEVIKDTIVISLITIIDIETMGAMAINVIKIEAIEIEEATTSTEEAIDTKYHAKPTLGR